MNDMVTIREGDLIESLADAMQYISYYHPVDYIRALGAAYEAEQGLTPVRPGAAVDAMIAADPNWQPFFDGIAYGGPEPLLTDYKGLQNVMIELVQSVVTGAAEPAAALTKAAADLEQYK